MLSVGQLTPAAASLKNHLPKFHLLLLKIHIWVEVGSLPLCLGMQAFAERERVLLKEGKQLTVAQLLGCRQAGRFQDELALHLSGQLLHEERLLELGWAGGVF